MQSVASDPSLLRVRAPCSRAVLQVRLRTLGIEPRTFWRGGHNALSSISSEGFPQRTQRATDQRFTDQSFRPEVQTRGSDQSFRPELQTRGGVAVLVSMFPLEVYARSLTLAPRPGRDGSYRSSVLVHTQIRNKIGPRYPITH